MSAHPEIRTLSSHVVDANRWMTVREDAVERGDGSRGIYGVVEKPDFAVIAAIQDGRVHLVEQYRYPCVGTIRFARSIVPPSTSASTSNASVPGSGTPCTGVSKWIVNKGSKALVDTRPIAKRPVMRVASIVPMKLFD